MIQLVKTLPITPVAAPRQTQRDRWQKRGCVVRYHEYRDAVCSMITVSELPENLLVVFHLPMPKSWSQRKRDRLVGTPHQVKPDADNLLKAFLDAVYRGRGSQDSEVWCPHPVKLWAHEGAIEVWEGPDILKMLKESRERSDLRGVA